MNDMFIHMAGVQVSALRVRWCPTSGGVRARRASCHTTTSPLALRSHGRHERSPRPATRRRPLGSSTFSPSRTGSASAHSVYKQFFPTTLSMNLAAESRGGSTKSSTDALEGWRQRCPCGVERRRLMRMRGGGGDGTRPWLSDDRV